jgi:hypothetical protein
VIFQTPFGGRAGPTKKEGTGHGWPLFTAPWPEAAETGSGHGRARSSSFDGATLRRSNHAVNDAYWASSTPMAKKRTMDPTERLSAARPTVLLGQPRRPPSSSRPGERARRAGGWRSPPSGIAGEAATPGPGDEPTGSALAARRFVVQGRAGGCRLEVRSPARRRAGSLTQPAPATRTHALSTCIPCEVARRHARRCPVVSTDTMPVRSLM